MRFLSPDKLEWLKKLKARDISGVVVFGDVHGNITQETVESLTLRWDTVRTSQHELAWLNWRTRLSDFVGRNDVKTEVIDWAKQEGAGVLARFVTGEGGVGKTRLAAEIADELRKEGWAAGFVNLRSPGAYFANKSGTLILIDYPEELREGVRALLENLSRVETKHRIRLLFLSRRGWDIWEQEIARADGAITYFDREPVELQLLAGDAPYKAFQSAQQRLADKKKIKPNVITEDSFDEWLGTADIHQRPLFIAAAAIHSVLHPDVSVVTLSGPEVIDALVGREHARLADEGVAVGLNSEALPRLASFAAIRGDLSGADLTNLAQMTELDLGLPPPNEVVDAVRNSGRLENDVFPAPTPDILAAALVVTVFGRVPARAPDWLWTAISDDVAGGLERLGRLTHDTEIVLGLHAHRLSNWLVSAFEGHPARCLHAVPFVSEAILPVGLMPLDVAVWKTLADVVDDDVQKSARFTNLSVARASVGDNAGALEAIREAVEICRRLAAASPARYEPDLAGSLINLSNGLSAVGDAPAALEASREAVEIFRRLAAASPARYEPELASSLNNLSIRLSEGGDAPAALEAIREAVEIRRRLAEASPTRYGQDLASSLNSLSNRLVAVGDAPAALEAIRETLELYRRLAAASPARYEPNLAVSLNNLSADLSVVGDTPAALEAVREAVDIFRRLAAASPARYEPDLALSLSVLSDRLEEAGEIESAIEATDEAIHLMRPYAERYPESEHGRRYRKMQEDLARLTDGDNRGVSDEPL